MRLWDFPCGRRTASTPPEDGGAQPAETAAKASAQEKRGRRAELPQWRPSLRSISEDGAAAGPPKAMKSGGEGRATANAKLKPPAVKVSSRAGDGDYKHYGVVPAFAPTLFLF
ncbi:uncharacterized protein LOC122011593 [Zingiber officinale]|uniref:uncharacterized protein LOC122011593 n=1 Tax=Zingiber officinale TaxID=94328 RepID=UPI001C4DBB93|nr:uncharacterized protein LOC122011593 [Zingiber officinale]